MMFCVQRIADFIGQAVTKAKINTIPTNGFNVQKFFPPFVSIMYVLSICGLKNCNVNINCTFFDYFLNLSDNVFVVRKLLVVSYFKY